MTEVTRILENIGEGDPGATAELLPLVYNELRRLAAVRMAQQPNDHTLQATALVHEAYLRLVDHGPRAWNNRGHFFAAAAEAMRRILVERARRKASQKRGGGLRRIDLENVEIASESESDLVLALDEVLERYAQKDPVGSELIKLRFFVGLPNDEAAALLGIPERTAKRTWAYARAWLFNELKKNLRQ